MKNIMEDVANLIALILFCAVLFGALVAFS